MRPRSGRCCCPTPALSKRLLTTPARMNSSATRLIAVWVRQSIAELESMTPLASSWSSAGTVWSAVTRRPPLISLDPSCSIPPTVTTTRRLCRSQPRPPPVSRRWRRRCPRPPPGLRPDRSTEHSLTPWQRSVAARQRLQPQVVADRARADAAPARMSCAAVPQLLSNPLNSTANPVSWHPRSGRTATGKPTPPR